MKTIRTKDGKWLQIDPQTDPWIYKTPHSSVRASLDYRKGEDLYIRKLPDGLVYYYMVTWTDWQRESKEAFHTLSAEEAKEFLLQKAQSAGKIGLDPDIIDRIERFFPNLLQRKR